MKDGQAYDAAVRMGAKVTMELFPSIVLQSLLASSSVFGSIPTELRPEDAPLLSWFAAQPPETKHRDDLCRNFHRTSG